MYYSGTLNNKKIRKIQAEKLEKREVIKQLSIDDSLLNEKDSWYKVDSVVQFFKRRSDSRLFGECISQDIMRGLNIPTASYEIVYLNDVLGLMTPNFQNISAYDYYDLYNISRLIPIYKKDSKLLTFKELLIAISNQDFVNKNDLIQELIDRYVLEWVTSQTDGNPRNIMFQHDKKTNRLDLAPSFDRERCLGINSSSSFDSEMITTIWNPAIPYEDPDFRRNPYTFEDGLDANIVALYLDYPSETLKSIKKAFTINYKSIFDKYATNGHQFMLPETTISYLCDIINKKGNEKEKIITI